MDPKKREAEPRESSAASAKKKKGEPEEDDKSGNKWISDGPKVISIKQVNSIDELRDDSLSFNPTFVYQVFLSLTFCSCSTRRRPSMDIQG